MNNKEEKIKDIVCGLTYVYGPIHIDDMIDKMHEYFTEEIKDFNEKQLYDIIYEVADEKLYLDDEFISLCDPEYYEDIYSDITTQAFQAMNIEKSFSDKQDILDYADIYDIKNNIYLEDIKDFLDQYNYKNPQAKQEILDELARTSIYYQDFNDLYKKAQSLCKDKIDKEEFLDLFTEYILHLPRGYLNGFSLIELHDVLINTIPQDNRIKLSNNYHKSKEYSYQDCLDLADKLKETNIFMHFCSDNIIELYIDEQPYFLQLLGYYNNDRNIIFYGDEDNLLYCYQFMLTDDSYPDIVSRLNYCEISFDNYEGFLSDEVQIQLQEKGYGRDPLIVYFNPTKGPQVVNQQQINKIGNTLESLLSIEKTLKDDLYKYCEEGNSVHIVQLYLKENNEVQMGYYNKYDLGTTQIPFDVKPVHTNKINAKNKKEISIGIYSMMVLQEENTPFLTIIYDQNADLIIHGFLTAYKDMPDIANKVVETLMSLRHNEDSNTKQQLLAQNFILLILMDA